MKMNHIKNQQPMKTLDSSTLGTLLVAEPANLDLLHANCNLPFDDNHKMKTLYPSTTLASLTSDEPTGLEVVVENNNNTVDHNANKLPFEDREHSLATVRRRRRILLVVAGLILVLLTVTFLCGDKFLPEDQTSHTRGKQQHDESKWYTPAPIQVPPFGGFTTTAPAPLALDLPLYTRNAILQDAILHPSNNNPHSAAGNPQARAYHWLLEDMRQYPGRSTAQQYQRFALATLYYATTTTHGNSNKASAWKDWLHHDVDECRWSTATTRGGNLPTNLYRVCNPDTGTYESLMLFETGLVGSLPPQVALLTDLQVLDLGRNNLQEGILPSQLGLMTNLEYLNFFFSYGKGHLPSQLGLLTNLKTLNLERNHFTGTIPTELGNMSSLRYLDLERNLLEGPLPSELGNLLAQDLWELNVETNDLTGSIPDSFPEALQVRLLQVKESVLSYDNPKENNNNLNILLGGNLFRGSMPEALCSLQQHLEFDCGVGSLCGCGACDCGFV